MASSIKETKGLIAVSLSGGWRSEGNGSYRATMSDDNGITITERVNPDGSTDFIFIHTASPTPNRAPVQK